MADFIYFAEKCKREFKSVVSGFSSWRRWRSHDLQGLFFTICMKCQCTFKSDPILLPNNDPSAGRKDRWGGAAAGPARGLARRRLLPTCRAKFSGWLAVTSKTHQNSLATSKDQWHRPPTMMPHFQSEGRRAAIRQPPSSDGGKARHRIQLI